ncbi:DWNN domain protein [Necator americanus]|uniref:DWNN domain protein n=1 Tax=Necator americanus TaxID=51031 RepID=W2TJZ2_NECAM|nr:DWNN domain protein [Necator americanus]ETN81944.1 DWNN domain protein [Necator americanus]
MSSIHYKFRATLEYKTLQFDGLHITGADLKKEICSKEGIKAEAFDLLLQNAHTKRSYTAEELIPRNSSIIVQRVPREDAEKLPKIQGVNTGVVVRATTTESGFAVPAHMNPEEFEKLSEEDQIAHIKDVSTAKYHSSNFQKKTTNIMSGPPPPTYTCNRCNQPGHWYKNCPMVIMLDARKRFSVVEEGPVVERVPPPELTCPICSHLLKDAVLTTCCGNSFCADCISNKLMESQDRQCPGKNCDHMQVSVDALVPNKSVRQAAAAWSMGGSGLGSQDQEHMRFRIGLQPSVTVSAASTPPQTLPPPVSQASQPTVPAVSAPPQDSVQAQNSPTPFVTQPTVPVAMASVPSFSQPPPNMVPVASSSSSGDSLLPPGTSSIPPPTISLPLTSIQTASSLPPIPGVGLPIQHQLLVPPSASYIYNQPPPAMTLGAPQPQIMDAWDAFLHRKDRERERPRKRARSRNRSSSSTLSSSSADDRRRRRNRHEKDKRRVHRSDKEKDRDRGRDSRYRHTDDRRDRDRERNRERDWGDRHRENRPPRSGAHASRRDGKDEPSLPSLMGLDVTTPPNLASKRDRSRSRSNTPQNHQAALSNDRKKRKKKDSRWKSDSSWRSRKDEKDRKKANDSEEAAREIADEEAIDGTLREVAEFVRVEANCDDDGIEFELEEMAAMKETATEAEDEKSVTDTEPAVEEPFDTAVEQLSEADNEEPVEQKSESDAVDRKSESDATLVTKEDTTDKDKDTVEEQIEGDDERNSRKKDKKHKKHKKHKRSRERDDDDGNESKHRHRRKKEKKEKKEKRRKEKKHRRGKDLDRSDHRESNKEEETDEGHKAERCADAGGENNEKQADCKEERRLLENSTQKKKDLRKHDEVERRENDKKREDRKRGDTNNDRVGKERENREGRRRDRSRERVEKHRDRSHERSDRKKEKELEGKRKGRDSSRDRESEEKRKDSDRKGDSRLKGKPEKDYQNSISRKDLERPQEANNSANTKEKPPISQISISTSQGTIRNSDGQLKGIDDPTASARKHKGTTDALDSDEPTQKKQKPEVATSSPAKVKPALASFVKFKVTPPSLKKSVPLLKQLGAGDKESTDMEEDKSKLLPEGDANTDRRMREAFSPPKLQRKKITLNL